MSKIQIGWYYQRKEEVVHYAGYECAAWYENIRLTPGRYPMMADDDKTYRDGMLCARNVYIIVDGTVESDYFGSLYFGMPISSYDGAKNKGKPSRYDKGAYAYMVAESAYGNPDYEIFPEYEIRERQYYSDYYMEYQSMFDIYVKGAA